MVAALATLALAIVGSAAGAGRGESSRLMSAAAAVKRVPNEVGKNHQTAQNHLQSKGFFNLRERDCTGRGRLLLFDRGWKVVRQSPQPGARINTKRRITLCSVKYSDR
jgi:beta-lactam-binding protein with PASTA domain